MEESVVGDTLDGTNDTESGNAQVTVTCEEINQLEFALWSDLDTAIHTYSKQTYQLYRVRTSISVKSRNKDLKPGMWRYNETCGPFYNKRYICTHGWPKRNRGKGERCLTKHRSLGCPAHIIATLQRLFTPDGLAYFIVKITHQNTTHNHPVHKEVYEDYAEHRKVTDENVINMVKILLGVNTSFSDILEFVKKETGKNVTSKDIYNMISSIKAKSGQDTMKSRVLMNLDDFYKQSTGKSSTIYVSNIDGASGIIFQPNSMQENGGKFPEVVLDDATSNANASGYKLFSFMISSENGQNQFLQHSILDKETSEKMLSAINTLKENDILWKDIRVIMVGM